MHIIPAEIKPKAYPIQILDKDWSKRRCFSHAFNTKIAEVSDLIHEFKVREDDVWIVTLPKCGTTWMQELVWLVQNDYNIDQAKNVPLEKRSPFIEFELSFENTQEMLDTLENLKSPRIIKTHLSLPLLPAELWSKKPKTIYVMRDPKDALLSFYHFAKMLGICKQENVSQFLQDCVDFELETNHVFNHALEFYALRNEPWILYTSYEKMKINLREVILNVCTFLGKSITEHKISQMLQHLSFEEMKKNPQVNHLSEINRVRIYRNLPILDENYGFFRKGKVGSSKEELPLDLVLRMDAWIQDTLASHNLNLKDLLLDHE